MLENKIIATRELLYSNPGETEKRPFTVLIMEPYYLTEGSVPFDFAQGTSGCVVKFIGLPEGETVRYGADRIQALELAADINPLLKRLSRKYDFFWEDEGPYFE